jgi:exopolysaccharide biosynthesis polyprenyl glycosylphosphotransferase
LFDDIHVSVLDDAEPELKEFAARARIPAGVDRVIVASHELDERSLAALVAACRSAHVKLTVVPPTRGAFGTAVELRHIADLPVIEYHTWDVSRSTLLLKRLLDLVVASVALVVLLPLFALIAAAVKLDSRGPVLFTQSRAGVDGRPFRMLKFRTMVADAEAILPTLVQLDRLEQPVFKLADDPRVTRAGRFLRRASLDELPQLVNVLLGQMSLVGPRPEQVEVVERYRPEHRFRLLVKPGLTGPMQVYGRGALGFDERLALEREYIENLSFGRDLRLLALTVRAVSGGTGAF